MCNCEMVRDGAFVLVAGLWAAIFSSAFFGADFGKTLLVQTLAYAGSVSEPDRKRYRNQIARWLIH
jgi:hypothetical protein